MALTPQDDMANDHTHETQDRRLNIIDDRLNMHAGRIDGLQLVVMGDKDKRIDGLLERTDKLEVFSVEIRQWRRDITIYARAAIAILSITGIGTWLPYIMAFLKALGA